jgi:ATP synthase F1 gamma subunit
MASTRDIRRRIRSVKNTAQITKAMQMVAASKMRKAQQAALAGRPYAEAMNRVLSSLANRVGSISHPFLEKREIRRPCALVISTDKGLCGALNTNLLREVGALPKETVFVTAGKKGKQFVARMGRELLADFDVKDDASSYKIKQISQFLIEQYLEGKIDSVSIFHTRLSTHWSRSLRGLIYCRSVSWRSCKRARESIQRAQSSPMKTCSIFMNRAGMRCYPPCCLLIFISRCTSWCWTLRPPSIPRGWWP